MPDSADRRVTSEQVLVVLQTCYDPYCKECSVSVVKLGLIQGIEVVENGHDVRIELLLTSGWCPFSTHLLQVIELLLHLIWNGPASEKLFLLTLA